MTEMYLAPMEAGFEYVYLLLIVGYYLYKAFAGKKDEAPQASESAAPPRKKKKSFLEEILEQIEQQNQQPKAPAPVDSFPEYRELEHERTYEPARTTLQPPPKPQAEVAQKRVEHQGVILPKEKKVAQVKKQRRTITLGSSVLSPKDAVVAQVLFERKF